MSFCAYPETQSVIDKNSGMELKQIYSNRDDIIFRLKSPQGVVEFIAYMDPNFPGYRENGVLTWIIRGQGFHFSGDKDHPADNYIRDALIAWKGLYGLGSCKHVVVNFQ